MRRRKEHAKTASRRWIWVILASIACVAAVLAWRLWRTQRLELPYLTADSIAVLDMDSGRFLYEKESDTPRSPASLTKLMSLLLVLEDLSAGKLGWENVCTVTEQEAYALGSRYGMSPGDRFTVRQLVAGAAMSSGCDCIQCLTRVCMGGEDAFVARMNQKAVELGLQGTHFSNAAGLDAIDHYMTARDIARLSQELVQGYPAILDFRSAPSLTVDERIFQNTNRMAGYIPEVTGLKTGTSDMGGCHLVTTVRKDGRGYIIVLLGSNDDNSRYTETDIILQTLFEELRHG